MSFPLPSYSKFNKRYINPIYTSKNMIPAEVIYYSSLRNDIESVRKHYQLPRHSSFNAFRQAYNSLSSTEQTDLRRDFNIDFDVESPNYDPYNPSQKYLIYPYSLDSLIEEYYSIFLPTEVSFVIDKMLLSQRIISYTNYLAIRCRPFTKEEYLSIVDEWNSLYSFAGIANAVSNISNITAQYKRDYKHLVDMLQFLKNENEQLKTQLNNVSQDLIKAQQHTWM